jgi:hypothetical protein
MEMAGRRISMHRIVLLDRISGWEAVKPSWKIVA